MKILIQQDEKVFETIDPSIETTDFPKLLDWFSCLLEKKLPCYAHLSFTEPCISFKFLNYKEGTIRISINLSHELKPNFKIHQNIQDEEEYTLIFDLNDMDLKNIILGITQTITKYPIRNRN